MSETKTVVIRKEVSDETFESFLDRESGFDVLGKVRKYLKLDKSGRILFDILVKLEEISNLPANKFDVEEYIHFLNDIKGVIDHKIKEAEERARVENNEDEEV